MLMHFFNLVSQPINVLCSYKSLLHSYIYYKTKTTLRIIKHFPGKIEILVVDVSLNHHPGYFVCIHVKRNPILP